MSIELLSNLFLLLSGLIAIVIIGIFSRYLEGRVRITLIAIFISWLLYAGTLGYKGIIASIIPPGPVLLLIPVVLLAIFLVRYPGVKEFASKIPAWLLIGLQGFRVFVEIALYELYQNRLVPLMLTFEGSNFDIFVGLSAPLVAWLYTSRRINDSVVRLWSIMGIVLLTNVIIRSLLTFTGIIKTEIPNLGIGIFPFTFLPGLLAPFAMYLHIIFLRSLPRKPGYVAKIGTKQVGIL
ncbi:hypothetical protein [Nostoc sp. PCC 9305]|uniref:hypothetical protein n=1 Tax=Nostoc sp. PCC 9305 TaxID=296636 RepID=UPI0039C6B89C